MERKYPSFHVVEQLSHLISLEDVSANRHKVGPQVLAFSFVSKVQDPLFSRYLEKTKTLIGKDICIPVFIAALFTIDKIRKHLKYPTTDEGIKKLW